MLGTSRVLGGKSLLTTPDDVSSDAGASPCCCVICGGVSSRGEGVLGNKLQRLFSCNASSVAVLVAKFDLVLGSCGLGLLSSAIAMAATESYTSIAVRCPLPIQPPGGLPNQVNRRDSDAARAMNGTDKAVLEIRD